MKEQLIIDYSAQMELMENENNNLFNDLVGIKKAKNKEKKQKFKMEAQANRMFIHYLLYFYF